jgi:Zn-dependent peptidase ImmA (M78 family)/DNA-binding XRE family transcriptional regulator
MRSRLVALGPSGAYFPPVAAPWLRIVSATNRGLLRFVIDYSRMLYRLEPAIPPVSETTTWVARRIRESREELGLSQAQLAERLDRTQTAVSLWESGKRTAGLDDLIDIADALDVEVSRFLPPNRARRPVEALLRATAERLVDHELYEAVDKLATDAEDAILGEAELSVSAAAPAHAANELLEKAKVGAPPINVEDLCRKCGVLVLARSFPEALSGLVFAYQDGAVIGINSSHPDTRQRFTMAHELGHYILRHHERSRGHEERFHLDLIDGTPPGFDWRAERAANDFAADLLMPRRFMAAAFRESQDPVKLAAKFDVSQVTMGIRLQELGLR